MLKSKRLLAILVSFTLLLSTFVPVQAIGTTQNAPIYTSFNYYWARELLNDSRVIYPNTEITREEFIILLENVFNILDGNKERIFYNLPPDWWVDEHGVIDKNNILLPTEAISREVASKLLCDIFGLSADISEVDIPDISSVSTENETSVKIMVQSDYLRLYPNGFFHPEKNVTVSQVTRVLEFVTKYLYKNDRLMDLKISPLGANLISNEGFDEPLSSAIPDELGYVDTENSWIFFTNNGGDGTFSIEDGMARVDITNNDGVPDYGIQLIQAPISLKKGDVYKIIFDAKSTDTRDLSIKMGSTGDKGWLAYNSTQTVQIDDTLKTYSLEFTMAQPDDDNARMEFFFAASTEPVWVDNIKVYKVDHVDIITLEELLNRTNTEADEDLVEDWQLVWNDEFDGTELNTDYWNYDVGWGPFDNGWGNFELEYYVPENVSVENGNLVIKVTEEERTVYEADGKPFTTYYSSGRVNTKGKVTPKYGRIEVSAKLLTGDALWPAVWMIGTEWPDENTWPEVGEIDIVELLGQEPDKIYGTVHSPLSYQNWFAGEGQTYVLDEGTFADDFHEYVIEWDEDEIEYYIDGIPFHIINKDEITYKYGPGNWAFDHEFYLIANIAVGGFFPGEPNENTIVPNQIEIDYIRVYEDVNPEVVLDEVVDCANELPPQTPGIDAFTNGTFDVDLEGWGTYIHYDAAANVMVENSEAKINVAAEGNEFWSIQLFQGPFKLNDTKTYTVSFDARADVDRQLQVIVENGEYVTFLNDVVDITQTMNNYSLSFTMPSSEEVSLKFMAGKIGELIGTPHNIYIDNVQFFESQPSAKEITEFDNGTFDGTLAPWNQYIHYDALAVMGVENNEFKATIENPGNESWGVQLYQGEFAAYAGKQYTLEFDARSDMDRDIQVIIDNAYYNAFLNEVVSVNNTMTTYKYTFTMPADDMVSLKYMFGNINSPVGTHNVYLDNIVIYEEVPVEAPPVPKLSFDENLIDNTAWLSWWGDEWSGYSSGNLSVVNDELIIDITSVGGASYSPQVFQEGLTFENGEEYIVTFTAAADAEKPMNVNIGQALPYDPWFLQYVGTQTFNLTTEPSNYMFKFTMNEQTYNNGKIVFELGNIYGDTTATTVRLSNINIVKTDNEINSNNWTSWWGDEWSGYSSGTLVTTNSVLTVDLTSIGFASYSPQVIQEGLTFENGKEYLIMFDAKGIDPRYVNVQVGRGLDYAPWFQPYMPMQTINLTDDYTTYAFSFVMSEETYNNGKIVFELGTINGDSTVTTVEIRDVILMDNAKVLP